MFGNLLGEEERAGCFTLSFLIWVQTVCLALKCASVFVCVLMSVSHGAIDWYVLFGRVISWSFALVPFLLMCLVYCLNNL